jgi:hypothetical protein
MTAYGAFHPNRREFLAASLAGSLLAPVTRAQENAAHTFGWKDEHSCWTVNLF